MTQKDNKMTVSGWASLKKKKKKEKKSTLAKPKFSNTHLLLDSEQRANTSKGNEDRLSRH